MITNPGKLVTAVLGGCCLILALIGALQIAGVGGGISVLNATGEDAENEAGDIAADDALDLVSLAEEDAYRLVAQRPLFNETRLPVLDGEDLLEEEVGSEGEGPEAELAAVVAGIIITPEHRIAMVLDEKTRKTMKVREGMPLEGELASWSVRSIEPRKVSFDGQGGGEAELELLVHTAALPGAARNQTKRTNARRNRAKDNNAKADEDKNNESRAEEIRRKVAERRAQMRADAARRRQQQVNEDDDN